MKTPQSVTTDHPGLPSWINPNLYPFQTHRHALPMGTMHYVDEGAGAPLVMVHGNPTWSFVYRKLITGLRDRYRCIAPDHIGFGQSDKPEDWSYLPADHAANLANLLDSLDLHDITLVVQDWGGPIGLSYAIANPHRIRQLVILNTWMWPVNDDWYYQAFSGFMGGLVGRTLIRQMNLFARAVVPMAYGDRKKLTREIHRHYLDGLPTPASRKGSWVFPQQIIGSTTWLESLWEQRERITGIPVLFAWGMKDIAFREKELRRWQGVFPDGKVVTYPDAGHYVQEEKGDEIVALIRGLR